jgi:hypothetical protein
VALAASFLAVLAAPALASASGQVTGAIDALGATAAQQLAAVAHSATSAPVPVPSTNVAPVAAGAEQAVDAAPQAVAAATTTVDTAADGTIERAEPREPADGGAASVREQRASTPSSPVALPAVAGHLVASASDSPGIPSRNIATRAAQRTSSSTSARSTPAPARLRKVLAHARTLARGLTSTNTPLASGLGGRASRVAESLLDAVGAVARTANAVVTTGPLFGLPSSLQQPIAPTPETALLATPSPAPQTIGVQAAQSPDSPSAAGAPTPAAPAFGASSFDPVAGAPERQRLSAAGGLTRRSPGASTSAVATAGTKNASASNARPLPASATPLADPVSGAASMAGSAGAGGLGGATSLALLALLIALLLPPGLRRLRLAVESLRATQFTLIPERPG